MNTFGNSKALPPQQMCDRRMIYGLQKERDNRSLANFLSLSQWPQFLTFP